MTTSEHLPATPRICTTTPRVVRVGKPDELITVVPEFLGFIPDDSVVVVVVVERRIEMCCRLDLSAFDHPLDVSDALAPVLARHRPPETSVILVGYGPRARIDAALTVCEMLFPPQMVADVMATDGRRWWCRAGYEADLAPGLAAGGASPVVLPARRDMVRQAEGPDDEAMPQVLHLLSDAEHLISPMSAGQQHRLLRDLLRRGVAGRLPDADLVTLAALVAGIPARDAAWYSICRPHAAEHLALWRSVVSVAPDIVAVHPLALLAHAAWLNGNGVLMGAALDRAEGLRPGDRMVSLLGDTLRYAVPPSAWDQMEIDRTCDECRG